jgi:hypothetical protein
MTEIASIERMMPHRISADPGCLLQKSSGIPAGLSALIYAKLDLAALAQAACFHSPHRKRR